MIRYYCDICKKPIEVPDDLRYVVSIEVIAAFDPAGDVRSEEDRDYLEEITDLLEKIEAPEEDFKLIDRELHQKYRFDLCDCCRTQFLNDPLGRTGRGLHRINPN